MPDGQVFAALLTMLNRRRQARMLAMDDDDAVALYVQAVQAERRRRRGYRGSVPGHIVLDRDHEAGHARIVADYFAEQPVYTDYHFRRR
jgi:hypothetical protein